MQSTAQVLRLIPSPRPSLAQAPPPRMPGIHTQSHCGRFRTERSSIKRDSRASSAASSYPLSTTNFMQHCGTCPVLTNDGYRERVCVCGSPQSSHPAGAYVPVVCDLVQIRRGTDQFNKPKGISQTLLPPEDKVCHRRAWASKQIGLSGQRRGIALRHIGG